MMCVLATTRYAWLERITDVESVIFVACFFASSVVFGYVFARIPSRRIR